VLVDQVLPEQRILMLGCGNSSYEPPHPLPLCASLVCVGAGSPRLAD
jgi:hypothetical protein